jgi:predicted PolB exonuclease-like 3'-5' exonuclease
MKIDFFFTWSKNEDDDLKSWGGGFKLPSILRWLKSLLKK